MHLNRYFVEMLCNTYLSDPCSTDHGNLVDSLNLVPEGADLFVDEILDDELVGDELPHDGHGDPAMFYISFCFLQTAVALLVLI